MAAGDSSGTLYLAGLDDAVFEGDEGLTVSIGGFSAGATVSDDESAPVITALAIAPGSFSENGGFTTLTASISNVSTTDSCFDLSFTGTATLGSDYGSSDDDPATTGTQLCVSAGDTAGTLDLIGIDDAVFEGDEDLTVSNGDQAANATISDDESAPTATALNFAQTSFAEPAGSNVLILTQSGLAAAVSCFDVILSGAAIEGADYSIADDQVGQSGIQVCVPAAVLNGELSLSVLDDSIAEPAETVLASVEGIAAATLIVDNDAEPVISGLPFDVLEFSENGGFATLVAATLGQSSVPRCFTIQFTGSAILDTDFAAEDADPIGTGTQLCVDAEATGGNLILMGLDDAQLEGAEFVDAAPLDNPKLATTVMIVDDERPDVLLIDGFEEP